MENNIISIVGIRPNAINLFPETILEEVVQNIQTLLSTVVGSVPLDRELGMDVVFIDEPEPRAMMKLCIYALETIQEYEPRVEVKSIDFIPLPDEALDGRMYPKAMVRIRDEFLS